MRAHRRMTAAPRQARQIWIQSHRFFEIRAAKRIGGEFPRFRCIARAEVWHRKPHGLLCRSAVHDLFPLPVSFAQTTICARLGHFTSTEKMSVRCDQRSMPPRCEFQFGATILAHYENLIHWYSGHTFQRWRHGASQSQKALKIFLIRCVDGAAQIT